MQFNMNEFQRGGEQAMKLLLKRYAGRLVAGWTIVSFFLVAVVVWNEWRQAAETALTQAKSNIQSDLIHWHWNAKFGPVYVLADNGIPPESHPADTPGGDLITTGGRRLTPVNAAYMTRLVFDLAALDFGVQGHITSLRPVRPENQPDAWESAALKSFERGKQEAGAAISLNEKPYYRFMKSLVATEECLGCHRKDGYKAGDIRGGISVMVPMEPLYRIASQNIAVSGLSIVLLWMGGIGVITAGAARLRRTIEQRDRAELDVAMLNRNLVAQKEQLEGVNKELEGFASTISHDLRSPLSTIGGFCNLLQGVPEDEHPERCARYSGIISREVDRMEKLINALLEFSRAASTDIKREPVNLSLIAGEIADELKQSDPDRAVTFTIAEGAEARGDAVLLRVAMQNLLSNAWKFTSRQVRGVVEFGVARQDGSDVFFVKDNGVGFDNEQADRMFEAFQRLHSDKEFEGTGIGLATVKRIITRHGGRVWAEGERGKGAVVYFALPATDEAPGETDSIIQSQREKKR
jgi:signal transduction histidine kinase